MVGALPATVVARYRPQAAAYAVALETALDRPVARCVFVLTGVADPAARQVEITSENLAAATRELVGGAVGQRSSRLAAHDQILP